MTLTASVLLRLHRIHRQIADLRERLDRGPRQERAGKANVDHKEEEVEAAKGEQRKMRIASDERQLQLKTREARIADLQAKLNTASSNKEYSLIKDQIDADEQANLVLQDEILEMLEKLDGLTEDVKTANYHRELAVQEFEKIQARVAEAKEKLEAELARITEELQEAEKALDGDFKEHYLRLSAARGEEALAAVEGGCCGSCRQTITANMLDKLRMSKPIFCGGCGCLLYVPEDAE
ncbi:zinc ribbon domain-containing protein [Lignipirellula cremea]|uniref:Zinc ribbon domain protein n=1 Tax=Lignipirellula cremea TaxID=2528010 RepID=A0A518DQ40_9BACT|nr:phospholipase [Lignipirellula cremea]QDU93943.1 Putative zinc ribbon domain protein [Lignipirellula cremea]